MMISPVVSIILFARSPLEFELLLAFPVLQPMQTYVHGLGLL